MPGRDAPVLDLQDVCRLFRAKDKLRLQRVKLAADSAGTMKGERPLLHTHNPKYASLIINRKAVSHTPFSPTSSEY